MGGVAQRLQEEWPIGDMHALEQTTPHQVARLGAGQRARRRIGEDDRAIRIMPGHQIADMVEKRPRALVRGAVFAKFGVAPAQHQRRDDERLHQRADDEQRHGLLHPGGGSGKGSDLAADDHRQERGHRDHAGTKHEFAPAEARSLHGNDGEPGKERRTPRRPSPPPG